MGINETVMPGGFGARKETGPVKADGKASTGIGADTAAEAGEAVEKAVVFTPSSNSKVHPLRILRGENSKVSTGLMASKKVTAGAVEEAEPKKPSRLTELRDENNINAGAAADNIAEEQNKKSEERKETRKSVAAAMFGSWLLPAVIIMGAFIIFILLIMNWYSLFMATALESGYETIMEEESGRFDGGYDKITYLTTKYSLDERDLYRYTFGWDTVIIGGKELDTLKEDRSLQRLTNGLRVMADPAAEVGNSISDKLIRSGFPEGIRRSPDTPEAIFWFGKAEMEKAGYSVTPAAFADKYEAMILDHVRFENNNADSALFPVRRGHAYIYVLSILDPEQMNDERNEKEPTRIEEYNGALKKMCEDHQDWCYVDITSFMDEDIFSPDGTTYNRDFYRFKLFPYLANATGGVYRLGRSLYKKGGLYALSPDGSLHAMVKYLYEYKNGNGVYDKFKKYANKTLSAFSDDEVQEAFADVWEEIYDGEGSIYSYKLYADQQEFIAEEYYKHRIRPFIQNKFSINIDGASYAFKSAVTSLGFTFAYPTGEDFENKTESSRFASVFDGVSWSSPEDEIITRLYDNAKTIDPANAGRWEAEKQDALAMFSGTLDMYVPDHNTYGYINWENHLTSGIPPKDLAKYTSDNPVGIVSAIPTDYVSDHDETGGPIAEEYTAYALSFADPPEMYGKGHYKLPYILGGASLVTGADCSGFVGEILATYGYLSHAAPGTHPYYSGNFPTLGTAASLEDIRVGDIVCYTGHVAIYIGHGQIVHEPSMNRSCGVEIGNLNAPLVIAVRRFDPAP